MSDDDWFEEAMEDAGEDDDAATDGGASAGEPSEPPEESSGDDAEDGADGAEAAEDGSDESDDAPPEPEDAGDEAADDGAGSSDGGDSDHGRSDPSDDGSGSPDDAASDDGSSDGDGDGAAADDDAELFEQDFAAALEETPAGGGPFSGEGSGDASAGDAGAAGSSRPFSDAVGASADAGGGGFDGSGGGFDGGFGGGGGEDFAEEDFDSDIPRIDLGIDGLDAMIQGGVPERTLMVAIGSAGTGKTTFGMQFLHHGLQQGENAVFITLEESRDRVVRSASEKGFAFDEHVREGSLAVVDLDPVEMASSLETIGGELPRLVEEFDASRLVLDSVSLLEMMYDDRARRRNEIYDFTQALKDSGVTTMLTSEASETSDYASRHGIVEYLTDAVFVLQYVRPEDFRETRMAIEIQKIRDANHSRGTKPYDITSEGIEVHRQANLF